MSPGALPASIAENLRFLLLEGYTQLSRTRDYLTEPTPGLASLIQEREPYVSNLRRAILRKTADARAGRRGDASRAVRAAEQVATVIEELNFECLRVVRQVAYLEQEESLFLVEFEPYFTPLLDAYERIERALMELDTREAELHSFVQELEEAQDSRSKLEKILMEHLREAYR